MREMVSELLGDDADASVRRLCPHPWTRLGPEEEPGGLWARGASGAAGRTPARASEPLLGAYPYSTVWDWHTDRPPVSQVTSDPAVYTSNRS